MTEQEARAFEDALATELRAAGAIAKVDTKTWAKSAGISHDSLGRSLRGVRTIPAVEVARMCRAIGEDPYDLLARVYRRAGLVPRLRPTTPRPS